MLLVCPGVDCGMPTRNRARQRVVLGRCVTCDVWRECTFFRLFPSLLPFPGACLACEEVSPVLHFPTSSNESRNTTKLPLCVCLNGLARPTSVFTYSIASRQSSILVREDHPPTRLSVRFVVYNSTSCICRAAASCL